MGQVENVDGLAGPAHVEVWDWQKKAKMFASGAMGHKGMLEALVFHPEKAWLIGAGGGGDNGLLAFWKIDPMPADAADKKDPVPVQRIKMDGQNPLREHAAWAQLESCATQDVQRQRAQTPDNAP